MHHQPSPWLKISILRHIVALTQGMARLGLIPDNLRNPRKSLNPMQFYKALAIKNKPDAAESTRGWHPPVLLSDGGSCFDLVSGLC